MPLSLGKGRSKPQQGKLYDIDKIGRINFVLRFIRRFPETSVALNVLYSERDEGEVIANPGADNSEAQIHRNLKVAESLGLVGIVRNHGKERLFSDDTACLTELGKRYADEIDGSNIQEITAAQGRMLREYMLDHVEQNAIFPIIRFLELVGFGLEDEELDESFFADIDPDNVYKARDTRTTKIDRLWTWLKEFGFLRATPSGTLFMERDYAPGHAGEAATASPDEPPSPVKPSPLVTMGITARYVSDPSQKRVALENANFRCFFSDQSGSHETFITRNSGKAYMEGHHFIPIQRQAEFEQGIDVPENIVCLCPACHRKIHLANDELRLPMIKDIFKDRIEQLRQRGLETDLIRILSFYDIGTELI